MLRWMMFGFVALAGPLNVASAATISAVLKPTFLDGQQVPTFVGYYQQTGGPATIQDNIGQITAPNAENIVVKQEVVFGQGRVAVRTDLTEQITSSTKLFKLTTYAWFQYDTNPPSLTTKTYYVQNKAYLEFTINGNYDWSIQGSNPLDSSSTNRRFFDFVKVVGGVEQTPSIASNTLGTGPTNISSTTEIGSGTYRLYYDHSDTNKYTQAANATNLDILFTFKSEDNGGGGGGGVVPEPSSVAVFGLLSLGSAVAKWRRKKSLLAA
jgi:hypothetical protein